MFRLPHLPRIPAAASGNASCPPSRASSKLNVMDQVSDQFPLLKNLNWKGTAAAPAPAGTGPKLTLHTPGLREYSGGALPSMRHTTWTSKRVSEWLSSLGLREYADTFAQHRVTGDLLEVLTEDHLKELGVQIVGHRLVLLRELSTLKRKAHDRDRTRVLWSGEQVLFAQGPLSWLRDQILCVPCCREPDQYSVTMHGVSICKSDGMKKMSWLGRGSKTTRNVDLQTIVGVTAHTSSNCLACGCAADDVVIDLNRELGLPEVPPLQVENGTGEHVAALIRAAVEEAQGFDGSPPNAGNPAMLRA